MLIYWESKSDLSVCCARVTQNAQPQIFPMRLYTQNHGLSTDSISLSPWRIQAGVFFLELTITINDPHQCFSCSFGKKKAKPKGTSLQAFLILCHKTYILAQRRFPYAEHSFHLSSSCKKKKSAALDRLEGKKMTFGPECQTIWQSHQSNRGIS